MALALTPLKFDGGCLQSLQCVDAIKRQRPRAMARNAASRADALALCESDVSRETYRSRKRYNRRA